MRKCDRCQITDPGKPFFETCWMSMAEEQEYWYPEALPNFICRSCLEGIRGVWKDFMEGK